ncbi:MAG TPA: ComF family protein [Candidatus Omnitrophota bacterium]|mgnify:CR=1 FL=1|nr:ComF family protein [Candidatus Omnitrophota bacterium]
MRDLIYPNFCLICKNRIQSPDQQQLICSGCQDKIEKNPPPFCANCGRHLTSEAIEKNICPACANLNFYFDRAFSPCVYTGSVKTLIREFKYSGKDYLGEFLGKLINAFIRDYQIPVKYLDFILPVPLHKSRKREREFNQAEILSRQIAGEFDKTVLTNVLLRVKPTKTQTNLNFPQRCLNLEKSFIVSSPELIQGADLLLVDDVLTTGATANEAAKCLKEAGAHKVILLTLAS